MKIVTSCSVCFKEFGRPEPILIISDYYDDGIANVKCPKGHESKVILQNQKYEILIESAISALVSGHTIESASSLSAAYERFIEFAIKVFCKKLSIEQNEFIKTFSQMAVQSERQIGGFLFLYLSYFKKSCILNKKIPELRNKIIHQGEIPTPEKVIEFGEHIFSFIVPILSTLHSEMEVEVVSVIMDDVRSKERNIKKGTSIAMASTHHFFTNLKNREKNTFKQSVENYALFMPLREYHYKSPNS